MKLMAQITAVSNAYHHERRWWDTPPPASCDASYFRLQLFRTLDAPAWIVQREIVLLRSKINRMQMLRRGVIVH